MHRIPRTVWLILAVIVAIIVPFLLFGEEIEAGFGRVMNMEGQTLWVGAGVLFGALALDIFLPVPSSLASTLCGMLLGLWGGFWLSFMAMNVSCALGYLLGRGCAGHARRLIGERESATLQAFFGHYGPVVLVALRSVPVLAEASVLFAGISRASVPWTAFLLLAGNAVVSFVYAWVGCFGQATDAMFPAFLGSMTISGLLMLGAWLWHRRLKS